MSSASLGGIKRKLPDSELTYVAWQQYGELLALNPAVDVLSRPGQTMASEYDVMIDFRHEAPVPRFVGDTDVETYWGKVHALQCRDKGVLGEMDSYKPDFFIGPDDIVEKEVDKLCVINLWSVNGVGWRLWPLEKWMKLVIALREKGYHVVHLGAASDPIMSCDTDLRGKTRLAQVAGFLAVADLCIAIDSFVAHAAHAQKLIHNVETGDVRKIADSTPTVLLAGPISPTCVVPLDAKCVSVSAYPDCEGPCGVSHPGTPAGRTCKHGNSCMRELSVKTVLKGVELVERGKTGNIQLKEKKND